MTPTEQDKGLREHLLSLYSANFNDGEPIESRVGSRDMFSVSTIVDFVDDFIMPFITAERGRVALEEWGLANEAVLKNVHVISDEEERLEALALVDPKSYNDQIGSYMDRTLGFDLAFQPFAEARGNRIAELKAQEEDK